MASSQLPPHIQWPRQKRDPLSYPYLTDSLKGLMGIVSRIKIKVDFIGTYGRGDRLLAICVCFLLSGHCAASGCSTVSLQELAMNQIALGGQSLAVEGYFCRDSTTNYIGSKPCSYEGFDDKEIYLLLSFSDTQLSELDLDGLHSWKVRIKGSYVGPPADALVFQSGFLLGSNLKVHKVQIVENEI